MSIVNRNGINFRELVLVDKVKECNDIMSFYFKDKKNQKLTKHNLVNFYLFKYKHKILNTKEL